MGQEQCPKGHKKKQRQGHWVLLAIRAGLVVPKLSNLCSNLLWGTMFRGLGSVKHYDIYFLSNVMVALD